MMIQCSDNSRIISRTGPHVQRTRKKAGCIAYAFAADVSDPGIIRLSEAWRDLKSLEAHLADDEFQAVQQETVKLRILERNVQRYKVSSTTDI